VLTYPPDHQIHSLLRNAYITVDAFIYPIDFYVIDIPLFPFCPIIFGAPFCALTKLNINSKKEVMSLHRAEEEVSIKFKELKKLPYEKKDEVK
jgi:hypothetical protein